MSAAPSSGGPGSGGGGSTVEGEADAEVGAGEERFESFVDPVDGTRWEIDVGFLASGWRCIWGAGCEGILDEPAADRGEGCCSVGAQMLDADESRRIGALGLTLDPDLFQHHHEAVEGGVFADAARAETRIVDGACIFLNRPGFDGGAGCALHRAAEADGERPMDWKPAVCWQLPLKVRTEGTAEGPVRRLRRWRRADWGSGGETMAWCCTERPAPGGGDGRDVPVVLADAYVGDGPVAEYLADELEALVGAEVAVQVRRRVAEQG